MEKLVSNGCLAGQKLELGRTEMEAWQNRIGKLEAWQKIICKTGRTAWQKSLVQQLGRTHAPPLAERNFGKILNHRIWQPPFNSKIGKSLPLYYFASEFITIETL